MLLLIWNENEKHIIGIKIPFKYLNDILQNVPWLYILTENKTKKINRLTYKY